MYENENNYIKESENRDIKQYFEVLGIQWTSSRKKLLAEYERVQNEARERFEEKTAKWDHGSEQYIQALKTYRSECDARKEAWDRIDNRFVHIQIAREDSRDTNRHSQYSADMVLQLFEKTFGAISKDKGVKGYKEVAHFLSLAKEVVQNNRQQKSHPFKVFYELQALFNAMSNFAKKNGCLKVTDLLTSMKNTIGATVNLRDNVMNPEKISEPILACYPFDVIGSVGTGGQLSNRNLAVLDHHIHTKDYGDLAYIDGRDVNLTKGKFVPVNPELLNKIITGFHITVQPPAERRSSWSSDKVEKDMLHLRLAQKASSLSRKDGMPPPAIGKSRPGSGPH